MGTSTVSGPFRSANGFQQLDENGVWVPVTGGGGGGGTVIVFDETTTSITLNFTEVGQIITVVGHYYDLPPVPFNAATIPGVNTPWIIDGSYLQNGAGYTIGTDLQNLGIARVNTTLQFAYTGVSSFSGRGRIVVSGVGRIDSI